LDAEGRCALPVLFTRPSTNQLGLGERVLRASCREYASTEFLCAGVRISSTSGKSRSCSGFGIGTLLISVAYYQMSAANAGGTRRLAPVKV
jgi:hypothetical protein